MKQGDLSQWNNIEACKNLLFFAQLVNELLFDYSIPSNRISTLNSHFLCLDAINVINGIERSGVNEGSKAYYRGALYYFGEGYYIYQAWRKPA